MTETLPTLIKAYDPCAECGAPLDHGQRYCVVCGTSSRLPSDPVARYLADAARTRRAPSPAPAVPARRGDGRALGWALALLPLAVGVGILVGRGQPASDQALIAALRSQKPPIVQISAAGAAAGTGGAAPAARKRAPAAGAATPANAVALQRQPTAKQKAQGAQIVKQIQAAKGQSYINQQRNSLPDTIVVP